MTENNTTTPDGAYYTTWGELAEGQQYRCNTRHDWATKGVRSASNDSPGIVVQARPTSPKKIMVPVELELLKRLTDDAEERSAVLPIIKRRHVTTLETDTPSSRHERAAVRDLIWAAEEDA